MKNLVQPFAQNQQSPRAIGAILEADSSVELNEKLDEMEEDMNKKAQEAQKAEQEQIQQQQLLAACPSLEETTDFEGEFTFEEVSTCLQILLELEPFRSEKQIVIEWPKGGEIKLTKQLGMDDFSMRIKRENNWFDVTGELQINEDLAMDMRHLLNLVSLNKGQ